MGFRGKEINLSHNTNEQTEEPEVETGTGAKDLAPGALSAAAQPELDELARRRQRRERRNALPNATPDTAEPGAAAAGVADANPNATSERHGRRPEREAKRLERLSRPRAPRAERGLVSVDAIDPADNLPESDATAAANSLSSTEALALDLAAGPKRGSHAVARARKKQRSASAAVTSANDNPALGALNRHLNMLMQQLATAHRVIGRIAAERDALRQQLADLQGVPVEEIHVTTIGSSSFDESQSKSGTRRQTSSAGGSSRVPKFNYFSADDIKVTRKRRLIFVSIILAAIIGLWFASNMGLWSMPANISRDSLVHLPLVGEIMPLFLAGWLFYRVFRVSSRGVKWVFPSEDPKRRRK